MERSSGGLSPSAVLPSSPTQIAERNSAFGVPACSYCGDTTDVVNRGGYVGGVGFRHDRQCRDEVACWRRRDALERARAVAR